MIDRKDGGELGLPGGAEVSREGLPGLIAGETSRRDVLFHESE